MLNILYYIVDKDIYLVVKEKVLEGKMMCGFCLWFCCGIFYLFVEKIGVIKLVFGYYMDDIVEIMFLNMFYGLWLKVMLLKLCFDDECNVVICLLLYCCEKDLIKYVEYKDFLIIFCNLCGL